MENQEDVPQTEIVDTVEPVEAVEVNEEQTIVEKAREMGWKPLEEFEGPALNWKGAGAFVRDAELFAALKSQSATINELKTALNDVKGFISKSEQAGYERAIKEIDQKRQEAAQMFDLDALNAANEEYVRLQQEIATHNATVPQVVTKTPEELAFEARNIEWYNDLTPENNKMKTEAILLSQALAQSQPQLTPAEHISVLETKIKKLYPERFVNSRKSEPSAVESSAHKSKSLSTPNLPPEVLATANRYVKLGVFKSVDEYIAEAKRIGVIK